jgi:hypothetical protein
VRRVVVSTSSGTRLALMADGGRIVRRGGQRWLQLASNLIQWEVLVRIMLNLWGLGVLQNRWWITYLGTDNYSLCIDKALFILLVFYVQKHEIGTAGKMYPEFKCLSRVYQNDVCTYFCSGFTMEHSTLVINVISMEEMEEPSNLRDWLKDWYIHSPEQTH